MLCRLNSLLAAAATVVAAGTAVAAPSLRILPEKLDLTGRDPTHGVIVLHTAGDGKLTDVTRRVHYNIAAPTTAAVDVKGQVTAAADGQTTLTVELDTLRAQI